MRGGRIFKQVWRITLLLLLLNLACPSLAAVTDLSPEQLPLLLKGVAVDVECYGSVAETTVRMSFYNPNPWSVGTEVDFRISNGCTLTGFALETQDGVMREGVPVDCLMPNFPFDDSSETGKNISLLQEIWNDYHKFRIFPIEAHSTRTMEMRHVGDLLVWGADGKDLYYNMPIYRGPGKPLLSLADFNIERPEAFFRFKMNVHGHDKTPYALSKDGEKLFFTKSGDVHRFEYSFDPHGGGAFNEVFDTVVNVVVPGMENGATRIQSEREGNFFYSTLNSGLIASLIRSNDQSLPKRVGIVWDSSLSGRIRDHEKEFMFLDTYFENLLSEESTKEVRVYLLRFRNDAEAIREFTVDRSSGFEKLRKELASTAYDGATNYCAVRAAMCSPVDEWLFFSEGDENYGLHTNHEKNAPVHTVTSVFPSCASRLSQLASFYGGVLIDLTQMSPEEAVRYLRTPRVYLAGVEGSGLTDLLPSTRAVGEGEIVVVAGRRTANKGTLRLTFESRGKNKQTVTLHIPVSDWDPKSPLAALEWARMKKDEILSKNITTDTRELRSLGQKFGIISQRTALVFPSEDSSPAAKTENNGDAQTLGTDKLGNAYPAGLLRAKWSGLFHQLNGKNGLENSGGKNEANLFRETTPRYFLHASILEGGYFPLRTYGEGASYLERLGNARGEKAYDVYLSEIPTYWKYPDFFLDTANILFTNGLQDLGLRVLSNLAEIDTENKWVARTLAYRLMELGSPQARSILDKILKMDADDPQSYRDLATLCACDGDMSHAIELLNYIATHKWSKEYNDVQLAALREMNALLGDARDRLDDNMVDPALTDFLDLDIRVTLAADRHNANLRLILTDGEGNLAEDRLISFPDAFGSNTDELIVPNAKGGRYFLKVGYADELSPDDRVPTLALVSLSTNAGKKIQNMKIKTARLVPSMDSPVTVMEFVFDAEQAAFHKKEFVKKSMNDKIFMILPFLFIGFSIAIIAIREYKRK